MPFRTLHNKFPGLYSLGENLRQIHGQKRHRRDASCGFFSFMQAGADLGFFVRKSKFATSTMT